jgi:predicted PurR-regulated permease PerM
MSAKRNNGHGSPHPPGANRLPTPAPLPLPPAEEPEPLDLSPVIAERGEFTQRALRVIGLVTLTVVAGALVVYASHVLLLLSAGVLLGIFLRSFSELLSRFTPLSGGRALAVVTLAFFVLGGLAAVGMAPRLVGQLGELATTLPQAEGKARGYLAATQVGTELLKLLPQPGEMMPDRDALTRGLTSVFSGLLTFIAETVFVIVIGVYLAHDPKLYTRGIVALVPQAGRPRAREILGALQSTLHWWLLGRLAGMITVGALVTVCLWALGVPQPLALGVIAGLLEFIPTIGPFLSVVPAALVALTVGVDTFLYVLGVYLCLHLVEGYVVMPLIEQRTVSLPPAATLTAQVLMGLLFGPLGLMMATPIVAVVTVLVYRLYIEDTLHDTGAVAPLDPCAALRAPTESTSPAAPLSDPCADDYNPPRPEGATPPPLAGGTTR